MNLLPLLLIGAGIYYILQTGGGAGRDTARRPKPWRISAGGLRLIQSWEDYAATVYEDEGGKPTVGWGHLVRDSDRLKVGDTITYQRGDQLLRADLSSAEGAVNRRLTVPLASHEYDALVSWQYNTGAIEAADCDLRDRLNHGEYGAVRAELGRWNKVGGFLGFKVESPGLTNRRRAEADIFERGYA